MKPLSPPTQRASSAETTSPNEAGRRLTGRWLLVARAVWVALVILIFVAYALSLPDYFAQLQRVCTRAPCAYGQISPGSVEALHTLGLEIGSYAVFSVALALILAFIYVVSGVILWRKSSDWLVLLVALLFAVNGTFYVAETEVTGHTAWQLPAQLLVQFASVLFYLIFSLFPDGRLVPRWTLWLVMVFCAFIVILSFFPKPSVLPLWLSVSLIFVFFGFYACLAIGQIYRYRHVSGPVQRQQTKWIVYGLAITVVLLVGEVLPPLLFPQSSYLLVYNPILFCMSSLPLPFTIGIALLRYRLWDIDLIINRTLVYSILTVSIVALYILVVVGLGSLLQAQGNLVISLLATGLVAVLFQPLRGRLQRAVNRLMYGERDDPYAVLSRLGRRLEATLAPEAVLPTIVETVAQALKLPYAAITLKQGEELSLAASSGSPVEVSERLPLIYQSELMGELLLAPRRQNEAFSPADRRLLEDLARQAGVAAHAVRLTTELQRSRERLVTAREEERRRLRRDLHDGLGPTLAALNLQAGVVRTLLKSDPVAADALVMEWRTELRAAIADIRRLVYELRPPALDELGLVGALRQRAAQYSAHAETSALQVVVEAPEALPPLSAAVEVACYRIAQEALANVVRHSQARCCWIRLWVEDTLQLEISDDGIGLPAEHQAGVGLLSMRERAGELGGTCVVEPIATGGTRVSARLPFPKQ